MGSFVIQARVCDFLSGAEHQRIHRTSLDAVRAGQTVRIALLRIRHGNEQK